MSPTERSLRHCRDLGWVADVAEKWVPFSRNRRDLFGFVDVVALTGEHILAIQATSGSNVAARLKKIRDLPAHRDWLKSGGLLEVWGWRQVAHKNKDGSRSKVDRWSVRRVPIFP